MKIIIIQKINIPLLLVLYICYLAGDHNASHLRNKLTFATRLKSKSYLFPSTTENCGTMCLECSQNDLQSCITCQPGIYEYKNKCYNACPENTYADEEWQICSACDPSCPVCWGPSSDMCGNRKGTKTIAVLLENEIKEFFLKKKFENYDRIKEQREQEEKQKVEYGIYDYNTNIRNNANNNFQNNSINKAIKNYQDYQNVDRNSNNNNKYEKEENKNYNVAWLNKINVILRDVERENLFPQSHKNKIDFNNNRSEIDTATIPMEDVYGSDKIMAELPAGSFSRKDGVFIPIPSYLDDNLDIVESHWVYVRGAWLGNRWKRDWVPVLPTFIHQYGEKNKMYFENGGYWFFDNRKDWAWKQMDNNSIPTDVGSIEEILQELNTIRFDDGDLNYIMMQNKLRMKKLELNNGLDRFFNEFIEKNKLIFAKLKDSVNMKENTLISSLQNLKRKVSLFYNEEQMMIDPTSFNPNIKNADFNLRKAK